MQQEDSMNSSEEWEDIQGEVEYESGIEGGYDYMVINYQDTVCLDSNTISARQADKTTPRICVSTPNPCVHSHRWRFEATPTGAFRLVTLHHRRGEELELDGNLQSSVTQWDYAFPSPFLWAVRSNAVNHCWRLVRVPETEERLFYIVNELHGKCLDAAVDLATHPDPNFKSPYMRQFNPLKNTRSQMWRIHRIREIPYELIPEGYYMIVNVENKSCLDANTNKPNQISQMNPRIYTDQCYNKLNPTLHWYLGHSGHDNQFFIIPRFDPDHRELSGKQCDLNAFGSPFLVNPKSLFHSELEADKLSRRWKLYAAPGVENAYLIVNIQNGMCLDGNHAATAEPPFLVRTILEDEKAKSCMWYLQPMSPSVVPATNNSSSVISKSSS